MFGPANTYQNTCFRPYSPMHNDYPSGNYDKRFSSERNPNDKTINGLRIRVNNVEEINYYVRSK